MSWEYVGTCMICGKTAIFREPNIREYSCLCGDVGIRINEARSSKTGISFLSKASTLERLKEIASNGLRTAIAKIRAAGSEAYSRPGSRPESPPRGRVPQGPSGGNIASTLGTVDAFSSMISGIEAIKVRGKLSEERLRTIVSELITLVYAQR